MTDSSTPLPQIVRFLAPKTAILIDWQTPADQIFVLRAVRGALIFWEGNGDVPDPITLQERLHGFVKAQLGGKE